MNTGLLFDDQIGGAASGLEIALARISRQAGHVFLTIARTLHVKPVVGETQGEVGQEFIQIGAAMIYCTRFRNTGFSHYQPSGSSGCGTVLGLDDQTGADGSAGGGPRVEN